MILSFLFSVSRSSITEVPEFDIAETEVCHTLIRKLLLRLHREKELYEHITSLVAYHEEMTVAAETGDTENDAADLFAAVCTQMIKLCDECADFRLAAIVQHVVRSLQMPNPVPGFGRSLTQDMRAFLAADPANRHFAATRIRGDATPADKMAARERFYADVKRRRDIENVHQRAFFSHHYMAHFWVQSWVL